MRSKNIRRLALAGMLSGLGVVCSAFYIPVGASKCFPIQHMANVIGGVLLGPWYAVGMAFATSLIRNLLGTGSLMAFPGSMVGALLCGLLYQRTQRLAAAFLGEVVGTGFLGALLAYPMALLLMGNREAAVFGYVLPFFVSSLGGAAIALSALGALQKTPLLTNARTALNGR